MQLKNDGYALQYASDELKNNIKLIRLATEN